MQEHPDLYSLISVSFDMGSLTFSVAHVWNFYIYMLRVCVSSSLLFFLFKSLFQISLFVIASNRYSHLEQTCTRTLVVHKTTSDATAATVTGALFPRVRVALVALWTPLRGRFASAEQQDFSVYKRQRLRICSALSSFQTLRYTLLAHSANNYECTVLAFSRRSTNR